MLDGRKTFAELGEGGSHLKSIPPLCIWSLYSFLKAISHPLHNCPDLDLDFLSQRLVPWMLHLIGIRQMSCIQPRHTIPGMCFPNAFCKAFGRLSWCSACSLILLLKSVSANLPVQPSKPVAALLCPGRDLGLADEPWFLPCHISHGPVQMPSGIPLLT